MFEMQWNWKNFKGEEMKRYGLINFAIDATLTIFTGGLWLIWIFVREVRKK